jgi:hypothetical protein
MHNDRDEDMVPMLPVAGRGSLSSDEAMGMGRHEEEEDVSMLEAGWCVRAQTFVPMVSTASPRGLVVINNLVS